MPGPSLRGTRGSRRCSSARSPRSARARERHPRHGRDARLRPRRAGARRAGLPRALGGARLRHHALPAPPRREHRRGPARARAPRPRDLPGERLLRPLAGAPRARPPRARRAARGRARGAARGRRGAGRPAAGTARPGAASRASLPARDGACPGLPRRRPRAHAQPPARRTHPPPGLRAPAARRGGARVPGLRLPRPQRTRAGRGSAARLRRALRGPRALGCGRGAGDLRVRRPLRALPRAGPGRVSGRPSDGGDRDALALRVEALEGLLHEKGFLEPAQVDAIVRRYEEEVGPVNGAAVVARAWADPAYKGRLLADGTAAIAELGFGGPQGEYMVVVENTPRVHNVVVCTLCSCYPWPVLGLPPAWYKSPAYRSRVVREPRAVLRELGLELAPEVEVRVWDSSSEVRYLVLPERPAGGERLSEAELRALVTRDAMIGVAKARAPEGASAA